jgi:pimeloyl-ACP methyl ester carboxylesterase
MTSVWSQSGGVTPNPSYAVLPGSGSAGLVWERAASELGARIFPLPDERDVAGMCETLLGDIERMPRPLVLVGSSLGALVALELADRTPVDALVLIAAGFGIDVHPSVLKRIAANPPGLLRTMSRGVVADGAAESVTELVERDFETRGQAVLLRHMTVLAGHRPQPPADPPPTLVLWGSQDPGVPLTAHVELALQCRGVLVPVAQAGHLPYLEQPEVTVRWIRAASHLLELTSA